MVAINGNKIGITSSRLIFLALTVSCVHAQTLTAKLTTTPVSPGGTAQIALILDSPAPLILGTLSLDLDPTVFGDITAINAFSATGDQIGAADIRARHAEVEFKSGSGGIGRLPGYPVLQITVPVLATATAGSIGTISAMSDNKWRDVTGRTYTLNFKAPGVQVGEGPSIKNVMPGGGALPSGTEVVVNGQGFTKSTKLQIDNVAWTNLQFLSPQQLKFTLSGAANLHGKRFLVSDDVGAQATYYSALTQTIVRRIMRIPASVQPIFPSVGYSDGVILELPEALENSSLEPIEVLLTQERIGRIDILHPSPPIISTNTITIPAGGVYFLEDIDMPIRTSGAILNPSAPINRVQLCCWFRNKFQASYSPSIRSDLLITSSNSPVVFNWRVGDTPQKAISQYIKPQSASSRLIAGTDDGGTWLNSSFDGNSKIAISVDPTSLSLGQHQGVITATSEGSIAPPPQMKVLLNVTEQPWITQTSPLVTFSRTTSGKLRIESASGAVPVPVSAPDWLSVDKISGATPLDLTVSLANPLLHEVQDSYKYGAIYVSGPGNKLEVLVNVDLRGSSPTTFLLFSAQTGRNAIAANYFSISISPGMLRPVTFDVSTDTGGNWLGATTRSGFLDGSLIAGVNPADMLPGTYYGKITIYSADRQIKPDQVVAVTLIVYTNPPGASQQLLPKVFPSFLEFSAPVGTPVKQILNISTENLALPFSVVAESDDDAGGVYASMREGLLTPAGVEAYASAQFPGTYRGKLIISSPPGSDNKTIIPYTITATPRTIAGVLPVISSIVNASSLLSGAVAPGEAVSLFGIFGPDATTGLHVRPDGRVNNNTFGNRVFFNGIPAPLTYVSPTRIDAVVPYEIAGSTFAKVEFDQSGTRAPAWRIPVVAAAPGLTTQDGSGQGPVRILNADGSLNSISNPAPRGSIVQIFGTGLGQMNPAAITGDFTTKSDGRIPILPPTVQIGGNNAKVISATSAVNAVAGQFQISAQIPPLFFPGVMPIIVQAGSASSQTGATIAVR